MVANRPIDAFDLLGMVELWHSLEPDNASGIFKDGYKSEFLWTGTEKSKAGGGKDWRATNSAMLKLEIPDEALKGAIEVPRDLVSNWYEEGFEKFGAQKPADAYRYECVKGWMRNNGGNVFKIKRGSGWWYVFTKQGISSSRPLVMGLSGTGLAASEIPDHLKSSTEVKLGKAAKLLRIGGKALVVVGIGLDVWELYTADDKWRAATGMAGGWGGAWAGASTGAWIGAFGGPFAVITVPAGAIIGGVGGYYLGDLGAKALYDAYFTKGVKIESYAY
jgi:hypothetical protein